MLGNENWQQHRIFISFDCVLGYQNKIIEEVGMFVRLSKGLSYNCSYSLVNFVGHEKLLEIMALGLPGSGDAGTVRTERWPGLKK